MAWGISTQAYGGEYWESADFGPFLPAPDDNDDGRKAADRALAQRTESFAATGYIGHPGYVVKL